MTKKYTTRTAALKATIADIRKLNIKGTPFSKVISANAPDSPTENDIWKYVATTDEKGVVTINTDVTCDFSEITDAQKDILKTTIKVIDNKVLDANDQLLMNWDTKNFTSDVAVGSIDYENLIIQTLFGTEVNFSTGEVTYAPITEWNSDLSSLIVGDSMFAYCDALESFSGDLSSLTNGSSMFASTAFTEWNTPLPKLTNGNMMFQDCTNLTSFSGDLSSLTNSLLMFDGTSLTSWNIDLPNLTNGLSMFWHTALTSWNIALPSLTNGLLMFADTSLTSWNIDLPSLTNGLSMFMSCTNLTSFSGDLSSLTDGSCMFFRSALTSWNTDLPSLSDGFEMFLGTALTSWNTDLPSLTNGMEMFYNCTSLTSFSSDLPNLTNGREMFISCTNLTSFSGDLSSLITGDKMFNKCKLDAQSVMFIVESIKDIAAEKSSLIASDYVTRTGGTGTIDDPYIYSKPFGWMSDGTYVYTYTNTYNIAQSYTTTIAASDVGKITIGIDITNDASTIDTQLQEFAEAAYYDSWADLKAAFSVKGWIVTWQYSGTSTSITLSEDEAFRGVPVWAKIEEVIPAGETYTEEEKLKASYCTEDGTKYYNISWGHDVNEEAKDETMTDETKFFYFGSLLEACGYFGVIPKEYLEA